MNVVGQGLSGLKIGVGGPGVPPSDFVSAPPPADNKKKLLLGGCGCLLAVVVIGTLLTAVLMYKGCGSMADTVREGFEDFVGPRMTANAEMETLATAFNEGDLDKVYALLSDDYRSEQSLEDFKKEFAKYEGKLQSNKLYSEMHQGDVNQKSFTNDLVFLDNGVNVIRVTLTCDYREDTSEGGEPKKSCPYRLVKITEKKVELTKQSDVKFATAFLKELSKKTPDAIYNEGKYVNTNLYTQTQFREFARPLKESLGDKKWVLQERALGTEGFSGSVMDEIVSGVKFVESKGSETLVPFAVVGAVGNLFNANEYSSRWTIYILPEDEGEE